MCSGLCRSPVPSPHLPASARTHLPSFPRRRESISITADGWSRSIRNGQGIWIPAQAGLHWRPRPHSRCSALDGSISPLSYTHPNMVYPVGCAPHPTSPPAPFTPTNAPGLTKSLGRALGLGFGLHRSAGREKRPPFSSPTAPGFSAASCPQLPPLPPV